MKIVVARGGNDCQLSMGLTEPGLEQPRRIRREWVSPLNVYHFFLNKKSKPEPTSVRASFSTL